METSKIFTYKGFNYEIFHQQLESKDIDHKLTHILRIFEQSNDKVAIKVGAWDDYENNRRDIKSIIKNEIDKYLRLQQEMPPVVELNDFDKLDNNLE